MLCAQHSLFVFVLLVRFFTQRYPKVEGKSHLSLVTGGQGHMETKTSIINFHQALQPNISNTDLSFLVIRLVL